MTCRQRQSVFAPESICKQRRLAVYFVGSVVHPCSTCLCGRYADEVCFCAADSEGCSCLLTCVDPLFHPRVMVLHLLSCADNGTRRISVTQAVECLEQMDFLISGDAADFVRGAMSTPPTDGLDLNDVIKVCARARACVFACPGSGNTSFAQCFFSHVFLWVC